jgi:O-antigen ligase
VLPALYFAVLVVAAVGWAGVARTAARFEGAGVELSERAAAWRDAVQIARDFPVAGTGIGGFGTAMLAYQTAERHSIYEQAHNEYLQIFAEGGVLVLVPSTIALVVIVRTIRHRIRGRDDLQAFWWRAGAVAGLAGIAAQSLMEFSLQMPGNALLCVFLLAVALHRPSSHPDAHRV